jgi:glycosyltransferase involved in cell wall biosynthesis
VSATVADASPPAAAATAPRERRRRVLIVTDAWHPQINGVVRSLENTARELPAFGTEATFLTPAGFRSVPLPTYNEIRLSITTPGAVARAIRAAEPDFIHIATEGPLGVLARRYCRRNRLPFTTSYHTKFPEYVAARLPVPPRLTYAILRRFHNKGAGVMVTTPTMERELASRGFSNIMRWSRGVDASLFRPRPDADLGLPRPVFLYVGRLAVEKSVHEFLALDLPGSKVVVGDGPARADLEARFPDATFLGVKQGEDLARCYAAADVFVFPSRTDTFGIVLLEALASGLPIAAYPVTGPVDVVGGTDVGVLDDDLRRACLEALKIPKERCRAFAMNLSWAACARQFHDNLIAANARFARSTPTRRRA